MKEYKTGLWKKTSKQGNIYVSGKIKIEDKEYYISLFNNTKKEEKQPDFNIILRQAEEIKEKKSVTLDEVVYTNFGKGLNTDLDDDYPF